MEIDLLPFCCTYDERMIKPFVMGGKRYATNGVIAIEVDAAGEPDTPLTGGNRVDLPDARKAFADTWDEEATFRPWPAESHVMGKVECPQCEHVTCKECGGEGFEVCDLGHEHDCDTCDGYGEIRNPKCICNGTGEVIGPLGQWIDKQQIDIKYDRLIRALPGPVKHMVNGHAVCFRFAGGRGIVMTFYDNIQD